jgi:hypothetical protein
MTKRIKGAILDCRIPAEKSLVKIAFEISTGAEYQPRCTPAD